MKNIFADRTKHMSGSAIREILKVTANPEVISLAGGLPAPESFPLDIINILHANVMEKYGAAAFQYGVTEGFAPFRKAVATYVKRKGIETTEDNVYVTSGSQAALDAVSKVFINKGDIIAVEAPTYLGAMSAFNAYEPTYVEIATDGEGILIDALEDVLKKNNVKLVYLNPTFQNPTGKTLSLERRKAVATLLKKYDVRAIEDDPYSELRYRGERVQSIKSLAPDHVIYMSTMSKIFAPGLRLGFFVAPKEIGEWMTIAKQGADLHTSSYGQALAAEYLEGNYLDVYLPKIIALYKPRQECMLKALETYFPDSYEWTKPDGGMFVWVTGPDGMNAIDLYWKAIKENVAFVPGTYFYAKENTGLNTMRLNFTNSKEETIETAIKRLASAISNS